MPDLSILTCASGRPELFRRHLAALVAAGPASCEYCLVFWGPHAENLAALAEASSFFGKLRLEVVRTDRYFPLPVAMNAALRLASAPRCLILGAEVAVPPGYLAWAAARDEPSTAWVPRCLEPETGRQLCYERQKGAWPHAMALPTAALRRIGGWDEAFADGVVYDDVDLALRLLIGGVRFRWAFDWTVLHHAHPQAHPHIADRSRHVTRNQRLVIDRLGGYPISDIWPAWWQQLNSGRPYACPEDDGPGRQDALAAELVARGYPMRGSL